MYPLFMNSHLAHILVQHYFLKSIDDIHKPEMSCIKKPLIK